MSEFKANINKMLMRLEVIGKFEAKGDLKEMLKQFINSDAIKDYFKRVEIILCFKTDKALYIITKDYIETIDVDIIRVYEIPYEVVEE